MKNDIYIAVRIPTTLRDQIQADADKQDRPAGYIVRQILTNHYNGPVDDS